VSAVPKGDSEGAWSSPDEEEDNGGDDDDGDNEGVEVGLTGIPIKRSYDDKEEVTAAGAAVGQWIGTGSGSQCGEGGRTVST